MHFNGDFRGLGDGVGLQQETEYLNWNIEIMDYWDCWKTSYVVYCYNADNLSR